MWWITKMNTNETEMSDLYTNIIHKKAANMKQWDY
jgi:hypothetical protein